jgi:stearoyl-CoA desaturase (delta-9 desaturase)
MHILLALAAGFVVAQIATLATTVYLHRTLSHRALTMTPSTALVFRSLLWITTGIKAREWVAVHRSHHANTDTVDDPHSPVVLGFWRVQLGNVGLYRAVSRDGVTVKKYARDLPADRLDRTLFDHAFLGLAIGIGILILGFGWQLGLLAAGFHTVTYLMLNAAVNAVGHTFGSRPYPNEATNSQWLAWLTSGEGLHNNHHAAPTSARLALEPGEVDPGGWLVAFLVKTGRAKLRHEEVHLRAA